MHRREFIRNTGITLGAVGLAGCISQDSRGRQPSKTPGLTIVMGMVNSRYAFDPIGLFVKPGETVTWVNESGDHSTTAYRKGNGPSSVTRIPENATPWNSGILNEQGARFEHTFEVEGTYDYFCTPHKFMGMIGRIVVGEPGDPAAGSMTPDGPVPKSSAIVEQNAISYDEFMS
jgi:plastocyanin